MKYKLTTIGTFGLVALGLGRTGGVGGAGGVLGGLLSPLAVLLEFTLDFSEPLLDCNK